MALGGPGIVPPLERLRTHMYIFTTQCFASRVGGTEDLMTNLALSIADKHEVAVFADQHFYIQDEIFDSNNESIFNTTH